MKYYLLAEKPNQAKSYADAFEIESKHKTHYNLKPCNIFPDGAVVTWAVGHLVTLKEPSEYKDEWKHWNLDNLPIAPQKHEYKVINGKREQYSYIKRLFNTDVSKSIIVNCVDIDREGSLIFNSILSMTGTKNKKIKRLWINSLEKDAIIEGFKNLQDNKNDLLMYREAQTRQIADWLIGMNMSQLYTLLLQKKGIKETLSVGRVQSPLVYMIYEREKEIENFVSKPFYELKGKFKHDNGSYEGKAKIKVDSEDEMKSYLLENNITLNKELEGQIDSVEKKLKETESPQLHSLSSLHKVADKKWKYSPALVLKTAQDLYDKYKVLGYPRSDCNYITENEFEYLKGNIEQYKKALNVEFEANTTPRKRYVDSKKVGEHIAIIPTKITPDENMLNKMTDVEKNIYYEVLSTTLAMFHHNYKYEETKIITKTNDVEFFTTGKVEVDKGWKVLFKNQKEKSNKVLPNVSKNDLVLSVSDVTKGMTTPPKRYSEGALIDVMKYASKNIENVEEKETLKEVQGIGTEATRSGIIETVKKNGYIQVKNNLVYITEKGRILCETIEGTLLSSPSMTAKWESYLKKIGNGSPSHSQDYFIKNIIKFINTTVNEAPKKFEEINDLLEKKAEESQVCKCPSCDGSIIDKGKFYGCSDYPNCKTTFPKKFVGKTLSKKHIIDLCTKKETQKIKGFKSKKGNKFDAKLIINKEDKIEFNFNN